MSAAPAPGTPASGPPELLRGAARRLAQIAATGAIFAAFSELWFYRVPLGANLVELVVIYGLFGYLFLLTLRLFQARAFASLFVAAAMFGFFIEGVPVPALYSNLPFSLAWTSLAWHALLTVSVGYYLYRRVMAARGVAAALALNAAIGAGLGIWGAYSWNVVENEAAGTISYVWQPVSAFAGQFLLGWAMFVGGHMLLDRLGPGPGSPSRREYGLFFGLAAAAWLLGVFRPFFPFSLILPFLLLVSLASLRAGLRSPPNRWLADFLALRIAPRRYGAALLIPICAIGAHAVIRAAGLAWETNVPVAGLTVPAASLYWLYALLRANHAGHRTRPDPPPDARLNER